MDGDVGAVERRGELGQRRGVALRLALGDERVLPGEPLHLPAAERQRAEDGGQRH